MRKILGVVFALFIQFHAVSQLSGTYTINGGFPTSGTNYASFSAAFSALNSNGVSGAVILNVVSGSGPYQEQVSLDSVNGLSSTNTLTINGNGNVLSYTTTPNYKQVLRINGCPYVTVDSLVVKALSLSDAVGIHVLNGSHNSTVKNCIIDLDSVLSSTNVDVVGIAVNGFDIWTNGNGTTDFVTVENNVIYGGAGGVSFGIKMTGGGFPATYSEGHIVRNNTVYDARFWSISIEYSDSSFVLNNDVSRPNMTTGDFGGIAVFSGSTRVLVNANRIHNSHDASNTTTKATGIYVNNATPTNANRNVISNNLIYNLNGNGDNYGLNCFSSNNVEFLHNTISLDHTAATGGNSYAYYQTGALSNIKLINNIFSITRGGSGAKYGYYFNGGGSPSVNTNNNVFYINSLGSGAQYLSYWNSTNYSALSNWQAANSGVFDTNSVASDPAFVSISANNYRPSSTFVNNIGQPLSNIQFDIIGTSRSATTPDPGAFETAPPPLDAGIVSIDSLFASCPDSVEVYATLKNFGLDTLKSVTVNWKVNGTTRNPLNLITSLSVQQSMPVYLGKINLISTSSIDIDAFSSNPNNMADTINSNDTAFVANYRTALNGFYSVGSSGDYLNLENAVNDLNDRGICGSVYFNVDSSSGPFTNQLTIFNINGSSTTDTIVFEGNGAEININMTTLDLHTVKFDGASFITFRNFNLYANGNSNKEGGAIVLTNGANYNSIQNCNVDFDNVLSSSFNTGAIAILGKSSAIDIANYNLIENCDFTVWGLRNGIYVRGASGMTGCYGNTFKNNIIRNIYSCGIYLNNTDSSILMGNDISRMDRLVGWTFVGIRMYQNSQNALIEGNRIHNPHDQDVTANNHSLGIDITSCDAPFGKENKVINNLIYNFNGRGLHIGINNESSSGMHCYHNTIVLDFNNSSSNTYGFQQRLSANNIDFRNNLVYVNRLGGNDNFAYYFQTANSNILSNNNALFIDTNRTKSYIGKKGNFNIKTLKDWQNSPFTNGQDMESAFDLPRFTDPANDIYIPFSCKFDGIGNDTLGILFDILDSNRNLSSPDPGAFEFTVTYDLVDAGLDTTVCISKNFTLTATAGFNSYEWSTGGRAQSETIFALDLGYGDSTIYVSASDSIGCVSTDEVLVTVEDCLPDGIEKSSNLQGITIFPNPVINDLNITLNSFVESVLRIELVNVSGEVIFTKNYMTTSSNERILLDISDLKDGFYFLLIDSEEDSKTFKIIKQ